MAIDKEVINMKKVIPVNDYGLFVNKNNDVLVDSRYIAKIFDMQHKNILQAIDSLLKKQGLSDEFGRLNFQPSSYKNLQNKTQRCYNLTRDGFVMLVELVPSYEERKIKLTEKYHKLLDNIGK